MYTLILDIAVLIVLGVTIRFCLKLSSKIDEIHTSRTDMVDLIKSLDTAVISTHKNLAALKEASLNANNEIKKCIEQGNEIASDMSFMIESGNRLAGKLERLINEAKQAEVMMSSKISECTAMRANASKYRRKPKRTKNVETNTAQT